MLDYFIFTPGLGQIEKKWIAYCPELKIGIYGKEIKILGNSMLMFNSFEHIVNKYNDIMSSVCAKCPKFTLHVRGLLSKKTDTIFIENENYKYFLNKIKTEYFIKVSGKKQDRQWFVSSKYDKIYTKNNIKIFNKCETMQNTIKTEGFFYKKLNTISSVDLLL
jgi:hypothetical protein